MDPYRPSIWQLQGEDNEELEFEDPFSDEEEDDVIIEEDDDEMEMCDEDEEDEEEAAIAANRQFQVNALLNLSYLHAVGVCPSCVLTLGTQSWYQTLVAWLKKYMSGCEKDTVTISFLWSTRIWRIKNPTN
jgi:hypothetical protein